MDYRNDRVYVGMFDKFHHGVAQDALTVEVAILFRNFTTKTMAAPGGNNQDVDTPSYHIAGYQDASAGESTAFDPNWEKKKLGL